MFIAHVKCGLFFIRYPLLFFFSLFLSVFHPSFLGAIMQCATLTLALLFDVSGPTYYELSGDQVYSGLSEQDSVRSCNMRALSADIIVLQHIPCIGRVHALPRCLSSHQRCGPRGPVSIFLCECFIFLVPRGCRLVGGVGRFKLPLNNSTSIIASLFTLYRYI